MSRQELIADLHRSQGRLAKQLQVVAGVQDSRPDPEHWSFRSIAAHLAASEKECFLPRVELLSAEERPAFTPYSNSDRDFSQHELAESLRAWTESRSALLQRVAGLPAEIWERQASHPHYGVLDLAALLQLILEHDLEHLDEVRYLRGLLS